MKRSRRIATLGAAIVATSWTSLFVALTLNQDPEVSRGRYVDFSPTQQRLARYFAVAWVILGIIALIPAFTSFFGAESRFDRRLALGLLVVCAAMPLTLFILVISGYFANYGS
jgi:hypothetical protein